MFLSTYSQKSGEDFAKFCGLLRIYELYKKNLFHSAQPHQVQIHHNHHSPDFPTNIRGRSANGVERSKEGRENER